MKMFVISDNVDTKTGMRLAGIEGIVVHSKNEVLDELKKAISIESIGVILITEKLVELIPNEIADYKINLSKPLIVEIPDRHGSNRADDSIMRYVRDAIGLRL